MGFRRYIAEKPMRLIPVFAILTMISMMISQNCEGLCSAVFFALGMVFVICCVAMLYYLKVPRSRRK